MDKQTFRDLYYLCLEKAALIAEEYNNVNLPRQFDIEFHGLGFSKEMMEAELAFDFLFLGENEFVFLVDLAVIRATHAVTTIFLRVSGFPHVRRFEDTFKFQEGTGPFKQLIAMQFHRQ